MAQLWGGRFTGQTSEEVKLFGDSIFFDKALWREDIEGSIAPEKSVSDTAREVINQAYDVFGREKTSIED